MLGLPRKAFLLWLLVNAAGWSTVVLSTVAAADDLRWAPAAIPFAVAAAIAESFRIALPAARGQHKIEAAVASAIFIAAVLVFPIHWAVLVVAFAYVVGQAIAHRKPWVKGSFNVAQIACSTALAGLVWQGHAGIPLLSAGAVPWVLATLIVYFTTNTLLVSAIVAFVAGLPVFVTWLRTYRNVLPSWFGMLFVGVLIAVLWSVSPWAVALAAVPLAALYYAMRNTVMLETQTIEALFDLADILDDRDPYTHGHSVRVGEYAEQLAVALGQSGDEAHRVFLAGRLHDIGKCAIRNEVLLKAGPLDETERAHMSTHAAVGGSMLAHFQLFRDCASYVRGHHERWDGGGYPDGLKGEQVPFGARVIAVVDSFDAMTTTRPYRAALPHEEAIRRLEEGAGTQWDPRVVAVFLEMLRAGALRGTTRPVAEPAMARVA